MKGGVTVKIAAIAATVEAGATCDDCYFRQEFLCALDDGPCPTFRHCSPASTDTGPPLRAVGTGDAEVIAGQPPLRLAASES